jgi:hypothetical protein
MVKKSGSLFLTRPLQQKMLPELYLTPLHSQLSASQVLTLEMLVWLLQFHKQIRIERLAACLPLPILYESRRRHVQRFLALPQLSIPLLWFPLIKSILLTQIQPGTQVILPLDRPNGSKTICLLSTSFGIHEKEGIWSAFSGGLLETKVSR